MKLREGPSVDQNLAGLPSNDFTFLVTGKSFKVLFNTLYPDKPKAITRELSTNGLDSQIAAGCPDRPFEVTLPTLLNPVFSIRDFGESLTEEGMEIYRRVFDTTRSNTNETHGQLGLGSKTPFAYTDSFSVTVWLDGRKRTYLAAMNGEGIPSLTKMDDVESDEEQGLMVSFPVQAKHFTDFKEAALKVFLGFDVKPIFHGVSPDEMVFPEPLYAHGNWKIFKGLGHNGVQMGCVIYPITDDQLRVDTGLRSGWQSNYNVVVGVNIGDVDIAANREALSFDDTTIANVRGAFEIFRTDVRAYIEDQISVAPSRLEAERQFLHWTELLQQNNNDLYWNGIKLSGWMEYDKDDSRLPDMRDLAFKQVKNNRFGVSALENAEFILWNTDRSIKRKRQRLDDYSMRPTSSWGSRRRRKSLPNTYLIFDISEETRLFMKQELGIKDSQFKPIESFPDPGPAYAPTAGAAAPVKRALNGKSLMGIHVMNTDGSFLQKAEDIPADFYWLPIESNRPSSTLHLDHSISTGWYSRLDSMVRKIHDCAEEYPMDGHPILFLTEQAQKRLAEGAEDHRWDNALAKHIKQNKGAILKQMKASVVRDALRNHDDEIIRAIGQDPDHYQKRFPKSPLVNQFLSDAYDEARKEGEELLQQLKDEYPLLFKSDPETKLFLEYINFRKER